MSAPPPPRAYSPLNHYEYSFLDVECCCRLCTEWRDQRNQYDEIKAITFSHNRSCMCWRCRHRRELQQKFLASASKRELYCELSWWASRHANTHGPRLMRWIDQELRENQESDGWWATLAQSFALSYWLARFKSAVTVPASAVIAVSGVVVHFRGGDYV